MIISQTMLYWAPRAGSCNLDSVTFRHVGVLFFDDRLLFCIVLSPYWCIAVAMQFVCLRSWRPWCHGTPSYLVFSWRLACLRFSHTGCPKKKNLFLKIQKYGVTVKKYNSNFHNLTIYIIQITDSYHYLLHFSKIWDLARLC